MTPPLCIERLLVDFGAAAYEKLYPAKVKVFQNASAFFTVSKPKFIRPNLKWHFSRVECNSSPTKLAEIALNQCNAPKQISK